MLIISWFVCGILYFMLYSYLFTKLVCREKFRVNWRICIFSLIFALMYILFMLLHTGLLQPYLIHLTLFIFLFIVYKMNFSKTLIGLLSIFVIVCFSEIIYGVLMVFILNINVNDFNQTVFGYLTSNLMIFFNAMLLCRIKFIEMIFFNIINWCHKNEFSGLTISVLLTLTVVVFVLYNNFMTFLPPSILLFTNIFCICVMVLAIGFFKEKTMNNKISLEYDQLLEYVKIYSKEVEEKNKNQHEYRNQLVIVKELLNNRNREALNYLNQLLESDSKCEDSSWISKLSNLYCQELRGLIYYKIQQMLSKDVTVYVEISPQLKKENKNKNLNSNLMHISKIMGIYLDNAIEAVGNLKDKYIIIESYLENNCIVFSVSNNYSGNINLDMVDREGYTTKGIGHGYGLSLVKDIVSKNDKLIQRREMNGIYFVQKLYVIKK